MKIICVHQSADLYGSDRSFFQVIEYLVKSEKYSLITVVLPRYGPLTDKLEEINVQVIYKVLALINKTYLKKFQWGKILFPLLKAREKIQMINHYDVLYVSTSVIMDFYLLAPFISAKKIIHIREIPAKWLGNILSYLIQLSKWRVVFNSRGTAKSFHHFKDSCIVHNAFEGFPSRVEDKAVRSYDQTLKILLIGRINTWKGQDFVISALSRIRNKRFLLKIVGGASEGNEYLISKLRLKVKELDLEGKVLFESFMESPQSAYIWSDVVVVPSKRPEPFGRIAIEAMSIGRPVIAANHGGLPEIIDDSCGKLFLPNDEESFIEALTEFIDDPAVAIEKGKGAIRRFDERFSLNEFHEQLSKVFDM